MSKTGKVFTVAVLAALAWAVAPVAEEQPPIRIGASLTQTGVDAALGQVTQLPRFEELSAEIPERYARVASLSTGRPGLHGLVDLVGDL